MPEPLRILRCVRLSGFGALALALLAVLPATASARPLGGNLNPQTDYTADFAFADAWVTAGIPRMLDPKGQIDLGRKARLGRRGDPISDFGVYVNETAPQPGAYTVTGRSARRPQVELQLTPGTVGPLKWEGSTGRFRVRVAVASQGPSGGPGQFVMTFRGTGGGVRDLHILRPGIRARSRSTFAPAYTAFLRAHRPTVLRAMEFTSTNNSTIRSWSERSRPGRLGTRELTRRVETDEGSQLLTTSRGMAWESVLELCRVVRSDCWLNIPFLADARYVRELARLVRRHLPAGRRVWIEYSNELWNDGFWQAHMNREQARRDASTGRGRLDYDGSSDPVSLGDRRVALRAVQIGRLFRRVVGRSRVRVVLAYQYANPDRTRDQLEYLAATQGRPGALLDVLALAPYVNLGFAGDGAPLDSPGLSADGILDLLRADIASFAASEQMPVWVDLAGRNRLELAAYEGGPDTFGAENVEAKTSAALDPRMQGLVEDYLHAWFAHGGGTFAWFTLGADPYGHQFGTWSISNDIASSETPKSLGYRAVRAEG